jgi:hypothetical protein
MQQTSHSLSAQLQSIRKNGTASNPNATQTHRTHQLSTSSEEAEVDIEVNNNQWQTMKRTKRNKISSPPPAAQATPTIKQN